MFQKLTEDVRLQVKRLEKLDIYTNKHVHNVPKITLKICQKLNVSEEKTRFYINCAYLHDIGKIFIPYEILQKPEKLTDEEYEVMKKHTIKGYELCMAHEDLKKYSNAELLANLKKSSANKGTLVILMHDTGDVK